MMSSSENVSEIGRVTNHLGGNELEMKCALRRPVLMPKKYVPKSP